MNPLIGTQIAGKYTITKFLGEGGLGRVFLATHVTIGRTVALKLLHPELSCNSSIRERFALEAKAASKVRHPNTVNIHDYGTDTSGPTPQLYLAMEFLQGETLHDRIQQSPNRRLSPEEAVHILTQVLKPLAAFHKVGVVHRDLKPDNIMLCQNKDREQVKLLDFGIAKVIGSSLTATGQMLGTPQYMAPEQIMAKKDMGTSVDIYAMGVILYEALAGDPPYMAESCIDLLRMHLKERPMPLREKFPQEPYLEPFDTVITKAMSHNPKERYQSAEELQEALEDALLASVALEETQEATRITPHPALVWQEETDLSMEDEPTSHGESSTLLFSSHSLAKREETTQLLSRGAPTVLALLTEEEQRENPEGRKALLSPKRLRATLKKQLQQLWLHISRLWRKAA
jgi:serine/threonine protein kinase